MNKVISTEKDIQFGVIIETPYKMQLEKWDKKGFISRRRTERKGWIYVASFHTDFIASMAIVDAGYGGNAFVCIFDRKTNETWEEKISIPVAFDDNFEAGFESDWVISKNDRTWSIKNTGKGLECKYTSENCNVSFLLTVMNPGLNAMCPSKGRPFNYTYKNACLPMQFHANIGKKEYRGNDQNGFVDFTVGYPPRETHWNWASMMGKTTDNIPIGFNFIQHHNDGLENGIWFNGKIIPFGQVSFTYKKPLNENNSSIQSKELDLDISFTPEGFRYEKINYFLLNTDFIQAFGLFKGRLTIDNQVHEFTGLGVVEEHTTLW